jgi:hypothetical protein
MKAIMINPPQNKEEANRYLYGWDAGYSYKKSQCAYEVSQDFYCAQCIKKPGYGLDKLYCKQHAKILGYI